MTWSGVGSQAVMPAPYNRAEAPTMEGMTTVSNLTMRLARNNEEAAKVLGIVTEMAERFCGAETKAASGNGLAGTAPTTSLVEALDQEIGRTESTLFGIMHQVERIRGRMA